MLVGAINETKSYIMHNTQANLAREQILEIQFLPKTF